MGPSPALVTSSVCAGPVHGEGADAHRGRGDGRRAEAPRRALPRRPPSPPASRRRERPASTGPAGRSGVFAAGQPSQNWMRSEAPGAPTARMPRQAPAPRRAGPPAACASCTCQSPVSSRATGAAASRGEALPAAMKPRPPSPKRLGQRPAHRVREVSATPCARRPAGRCPAAPWPSPLPPARAAARRCPSAPSPPSISPGGSSTMQQRLVRLGVGTLEREVEQVAQQVRAPGPRVHQVLVEQPRRQPLDGGALAAHRRQRIPVGTAAVARHLAEDVAPPPWSRGAASARRPWCAPPRRSAPSPGTPSPAPTRAPCFTSSVAWLRISSGVMRLREM